MVQSGGDSNMKERGQSLVEMALMLPILILIFVGLLTIGRLMYAHLVIIGLSRDLARAAVREDGLNWDGDSREAIGYAKLKDYFTDITIPYNWLDPQTNASVTVHLLEYNAGRLCLIQPCLLDCAKPNPDDLDTSDDFSQSPAAQPLWVEHWGADNLPAGVIDYQQRLDEMKQTTIRLACVGQMRRPDANIIYDERSVIVEVAYRMDWWFIPGSVEVRRTTQMRGRL